MKIATIITVIGIVLPYSDFSTKAQESKAFIRPDNFSVVLVPAVMHEFRAHVPFWLSQKSQEYFGFAVHLYQKENSSAPNYIATNQGSEAGVYLRYIVDHYYKFPDVAVFIHGRPEDHQKQWLNITKCVKYVEYVGLLI